MGKRNRAHQRNAGLRKLPNESKAGWRRRFAERLHADFERMDSELKGRFDGMSDS